MYSILYPHRTPCPTNIPRCSLATFCNALSTMSNSRSVPDTPTLATSIIVHTLEHVAQSIKSTNRIETRHKMLPPDMKRLPSTVDIALFLPNVHMTLLAHVPLSSHPTEFMCSSTESVPDQFSIQRSVIPAVHTSFPTSPRNTRINACSTPSKNENLDVFADTIYSKGGPECEASSASTNPLQNENVSNLVTRQYVNILFNNLKQQKM